MRGSILAYTENKGIVSGHDGQRYEFVRTDWSVAQEPFVGMEIDFTADGAQAKSIFPVIKARSSKKSQTTLALCCFFLGGLGIHRFLVGKIVSGIAMAILFLCGFVVILTFPVVGIWAFVDFIMILTGSFTDKDGNKISDWN